MGKSQKVNKTIVATTIQQALIKQLSSFHCVVTFLLFQDCGEAVLIYDPLPPPDSIDLYVRSKRPKEVYEHYSTLTTFFRSLLPTFNISGPPPAVDVHQLM
jgi:hypothetical protein